MPSVAKSTAAVRNASAGWPLLIAQATHTLNNHLAAVLGKAEIALMTDDPGRWRRGLQEAQEAGGHARAAVADLQCLAAWAQCDRTAPVSDVLALTGRLARPCLQRAGAELVLDGEGATVTVAEPATLVVALWLIVRDALERAGQGRGRRWTASVVRRERGSGWGLELATPGADCPEATHTAVGRAQSLGEPLSSLLGAALELIRERDGHLELRAESIRLDFPD